MLTEEARLKRNAYQRKWSKRNPERVRSYSEGRIRPKYTPEMYAATRVSRLKSAKKWRLKSKYDLTIERFLQMIDEQRGCCKICNQPFPEGEVPQVDHDHKTNQIRGLLCKICNTCLRAIDRDRDWGKKALAYLGGR